MIATSATLGGLPPASKASYLVLIAASKRSATRAGMERAWRRRSTSAADAALAAVLAGIPGHGREAGEARGAFVLEGAELGHLDQHGMAASIASALA